MISVIIPTYKSTEHLDLCLKSAITGQINQNQIIVVVDGTINICQPILDKYNSDIQVLDLQTNQGLCRATNFGVYNAQHKKILIVNDDNVFPRAWDRDLESIIMDDNTVVAPNQVEPYPSMFPQFVIYNDLGTTPGEFNLEKWYSRVDQMQTNHQDLATNGSTLPIFMYKESYMNIGGWDENYPQGMVADWDFFLKCKNNGYQMLRTYNVPFYHFASASVNSQKRQLAEQQGHQYAIYKWGTNIKHNSSTNEKYL